MDQRPAYGVKIVEVRGLVVKSLYVDIVPDDLRRYQLQKNSLNEPTGLHCQCRLTSRCCRPIGGMLRPHYMAPRQFLTPGTGWVSKVIYLLGQETYFRRR